MSGSVHVTVGYGWVIPGDTSRDPDDGAPPLWWEIIFPWEGEENEDDYYDRFDLDAQLYRLVGDDPERRYATLDADVTGNYDHDANDWVLTDKGLYVEDFKANDGGLSGHMPVLGLLPALDSPEVATLHRLVTDLAGMPVPWPTLIAWAAGG